MMAGKLQCDHGYVLMQDSCPGCDAAEDVKHAPAMVRVMGFKGRPVSRCLACGRARSHQAHQPERKRTRARNTARQGANLELAVMALLGRRGWTCMRSAASKGVVDVVAIPDNVLGTDWLLVQCKLTNAILPPAERVALGGLAVNARALPLVASRGDTGQGTRVQYNESHGMWVVFRELTGPGPNEYRQWTPTAEENEG